MTCAHCHQTMIITNIRQKYCSRECQKNAVRADQRRKHNLQFIAVDGEGQTDWKGRHHYVLLSVGDVSLHKNGYPLDHESIFTFLWEQYQNQKYPYAAYIGYYLAYDFTQWLKTLPENRAHMLISKEGVKKRARTSSGGNTTPFPVHVGQWDIDILGMRRFKLRMRNSNSWMYICDVGSYFQCSFLKAIDPRQSVSPIVNQQEWDIIAKGKSERSTAIFGPDMVRYNIMENQILSRLMTDLNEGFTSTGIRLKKNEWIGPGQSAGKWMKNERCPTTKTVCNTVPFEALEAGRRSYFGGWFELQNHGMLRGTTYGYDRNSAYPYAISVLPCLIHGQWTNNELAKTTPYRLVRAYISGSDLVLGSMQHRNRNNTIVRPHDTSGWFWQFEIEASRNAGLIDEVIVFESIEYEPCDCLPPLRDIVNLYQNRLNVGKNTSKGKAYKLVYNSAYGKLAQSIGMPKYANPIWASYITAHCRAGILDVIASHPTRTRDLVMVATDGVYFTTPHTELETSKTELGGWDVETKENVTLFLPGIYWDDKTRHAIKDGEIPSLKSRGVSARDLSRFIDYIDDCFNSNEFLGNQIIKWPAVEINIAFSMVSPAQALSRNKWYTAGKVSTTNVRLLNSDPRTKRCVPPYAMIDGASLRSEPWKTGHGKDAWEALNSTPYERQFGMYLANRLDNVMEITPEGLWDDLFTEALKD